MRLHFLSLFFYALENGLYTNSLRTQTLLHQRGFLTLGTWGIGQRWNRKRRLKLVQHSLKPGDWNGSDGKALERAGPQPFIHRPRARD